MPALLVTVGANVNPFAAGMNQTIAAAKISGRGITTGLTPATTHIGGLNTIMRESLVILREIGRGNWSRVPGSVSILVQQLGLLRYLLNPIVIGIIAAGAAVYKFFSIIKDANEALDSTGKRLSQRIGDMAGAVREASKEAADAYADQIEWMKKLGEEHDTLADKAKEQLAIMREEFRLRREASPDKSKKTELIEEQGLRKREADVLDELIKKQQTIFSNAVKAEKAAQSNSSAPRGGFNRNQAALKSIPSQISEAKKDEALQSEIVSDIKKKLLTPSQRMRGVSFDALDTEEKTRRSDTIVQGEVAGQKYETSLELATAAYEKSKAFQESLNKRQSQLEEAVRESTNSLKDAKENAVKQKKALDDLIKERKSIVESIAIHDKYDDAISSGGKMLHGHVNSLQSIGAYAANSIQVDLQKSANRHLASIDRKLGRGASGESHLHPLGAARH